MNKIQYQIIPRNNELLLVKNNTTELIYKSFWYMDFGKTCAEITDDKESKLYSITKKFQFWKWKMVYSIAKKQEFKLVSKNIRRTSFITEKLADEFEIQIHYQKKKSIYKNNQKIAEFDEYLVEENNKIQVLVSQNEDIEMVFLMYASLLIGVNDFKSKSAIKSQKELMKNLDPWF